MNNRRSRSVRENGRIRRVLDSNIAYHTGRSKVRKKEDDQPLQSTTPPVDDPPPLPDEV